MECFLTDLPVKLSRSDRTDLIEYTLEIKDGKNTNKFYFKFSERSDDWVDDPDELYKIPDINGLDGAKLIQTAISDIKHIVRSLILNLKWNTKNYDYLTKRILLAQLHYYDYPKTPNEKLNNLFKFLVKLQGYDGEYIRLEKIEEFEWHKLFFKDIKEFSFYLQSLENHSFIRIMRHLNNGLPIGYELTYEGLKYDVYLNDFGKESKNCFVAMSFDNEDLESIYKNAFVPILESFGFNPILVKDANYESEKTINDAMIALIKKSKFIIADFTKQKRNVYFEAGFAAGLGLKVIYTCRKDYFDSKKNVNKLSAFDTNHFPHIIWTNIEDLKVQLKNKIGAWIL